MNRVPEGMEYINKSLLIDPHNEISHIIKGEELFYVFSRLVNSIR